MVEVSQGAQSEEYQKFWYRRQAGRGLASGGVSDAETESAYARAGIGSRFSWGTAPGVLVVDFNVGSADPEAQHGMDLNSEIEATARLLGVAREAGHPVIFTTVAYEPSLSDAGIWLQKLPSLKVFTLGSLESAIDPRLGRRDDEPVIVKKGASPFFGTNLGALLVSRGCDTVILTGSTTSGCIRAAAIDLCQNAFPTLVPSECVGDRAKAPHVANLFDINAKYADVVSLDETLEYVASAPPRQSRPAATNGQRGGAAWKT
jgi:nicotinamidase-related amidase